MRNRRIVKKLLKRCHKHPQMGWNEVVTCDGGKRFVTAQSAYGHRLMPLFQAATRREPPEGFVAAPLPADAGDTPVEDWA